MDIIHLILICAGVVMLLYVVMVYNNLITLKNNIKKNWANIDVLLKQRHDELPKLIETCKQYMKHEKTTLEEITKARSEVMSASNQQDIKALGKAETHLRMGLGRLFAVAENYPDLKANESFGHLQKRISQLENSIADRRELYNASVNLSNVRVETFPDLLVAKTFNFKHQLLLEFSEEETKDVNVKNLF